MDKNRDQRKEILLVPIGKVLVDILGEIAVAMRKSYKFHVHIGRSEEPNMEAYSDERRQYNAEQLMQLVAARKRENLICVLGIVDGDMYAGEKSFIYGLNQPGKGIGVIALARLREEYYKKTPKLELFMRRAVTESVYQAGIAMGMPGCSMKHCALVPTTTLWRLDSKPQTFCETCQTRVDALMHTKTDSVSKVNVPLAAEDEAEDQAEDEDSIPSEELVADTLESPRHASLPEDESEIAAELIEPEDDISAEAAAMHDEQEGPEEPLDAGLRDRE